MLNMLEKLVLFSTYLVFCFVFKYSLLTCLYFQAYESRKNTSTLQI